MSKRGVVLGVAGVVVVLAVGGVATYVWVDYSQAQNSLTRSRLDVRRLGESLELRPEDVARLKPEDITRLKERYTSADRDVRWLEKCNSIWIDKEEISALRTALEEDNHDIDQLAAAVDKRRSDPHWGDIPIPKNQFDKPIPEERFPRIQFDTPIPSKSGDKTPTG
jgi:hypothetical protein